jgi:hypothetical protein
MRTLLLGRKMKATDAKTIQEIGIPSMVLMERAAMAVAAEDTHTDTPLWFKNGYSVGLRKDNMVSIPKMEEGKLDAQFLAAFIWQGMKTEEQWN